MTSQRCCAGLLLRGLGHCLGHMDIFMTFLASCCGAEINPRVRVDIWGKDYWLLSLNCVPQWNYHCVPAMVWVLLDGFVPKMCPDSYSDIPISSSGCHFFASDSHVCPQGPLTVLFIPHLHVHFDPRCHHKFLNSLRGACLLFTLVTMFQSPKCIFLKNHS